MEFKDWYNQFITNKENFSKMTMEQILEDAFIQGMKHMEENTPLFGRDVETKEIVQLPREGGNEKLLAGERWATEDELDVSFVEWQKERESNELK